MKKLPFIANEATKAKRIDRKRLGEMMSPWGADGDGGIAAVGSFYYGGHVYPDPKLVEGAIQQAERNIPKAERGEHGWTKKDAKELRTIAAGLRYYLEHDYPAGGVAEDRLVRDFNTLPELVDHARDQDGATHVLALGDKVVLFYPSGRYWPSGEPQYEAGRVDRRNGYWHTVAPANRSPLTGGLPSGAKPIDGQTDAAPRAVEAKRSGRVKRGPAMSDANVLDLAGRLSKAVGGDQPALIPGGHRWSEKNAAARFATVSPEHGQPIVVLVGLFEDGSVALDFFSSNVLSETNRYENIAALTYGPGGFTSHQVDLAQMVEDVNEIRAIVDGYAASWQDGDSDVEERRRPRRVRDYVPVDHSGKTLGPPTKDYEAAKRAASKLGGYVKFAVGESKNPLATNRRPATARAGRRRRP